jgi:filamentous hemagglutinin
MAIDERIANKLAGVPRTPTGYVWHHVEDGETLILIPKDLHNAVRHTGGAAVIKERLREGAAGGP